MILQLWVYLVHTVIQRMLQLILFVHPQFTTTFQVADFGLSKIKRNTLVSGGVRGTLPWMAPELLNGSSSKVSEKVWCCHFYIYDPCFETWNNNL